MLEGEADYQSEKELTNFAQTKVERALQYYAMTTRNIEISDLTLNELRKEFIYYFFFN